MIHTAKINSAKTVTVVLPNYPFARADKVDKPRSPIMARFLRNSSNKTPNIHNYKRIFQKRRRQFFSDSCIFFKSVYTIQYTRLGNKVAKNRAGVYIYIDGSPSPIKGQRESEEEAQ